MSEDLSQVETARIEYTVRVMESTFRIGRSVDLNQMRDRIGAAAFADYVALLRELRRRKRS